MPSSVTLLSSLCGGPRCSVLHKNDLIPTAECVVLGLKGESQEGGRSASREFAFLAGASWTWMKLNTFRLLHHRVAVFLDVVHSLGCGQPPSLRATRCHPPVLLWTWLWLKRITIDTHFSNSAEPWLLRCLCLFSTFQFWWFSLNLIQNKAVKVFRKHWCNAARLLFCLFKLH